MVAASVLASSAAQTFERFFAQEYARAVNVAVRITGDRDEAEDVAQDVFVKCAQARRFLKPGAGAWIHAAVAHAALNAVRARTRRSRREARVSGAPAQPDPQTLVESEEERRRVRAALLRLAPHEAQLLALRYAGFSYRECALALSLDAAQIGTRLARAERAFKKEIEREPS